MSSWPPPYEAVAEAVGGGVAAEPTYPPESWPSRAQLEYTRELILTGLLLIALPWVTATLLRDPGRVIGGVRQVVARG